MVIRWQAIAVPDGLKTPVFFVSFKVVSVWSQYSDLVRTWMSGSLINLLINVIIATIIKSLNKKKACQNGIYCNIELFFYFDGLRSQFFLPQHSSFVGQKGSMSPTMSSVNHKVVLSIIIPRVETKCRKVQHATIFLL